MAGGMLGAIVYEVFYKQTFNFSCFIGLIVLIFTLILGVILNKISQNKTTILNQFINIWHSYI